MLRRRWLPGTAIAAAGVALTASLLLIAPWERARLGGLDAEGLRAWVEDHPHDPGARFLLGRALERESQPEVARREYALAVELNPKAGHARAALARLLLEGGHVDEAARHVREGLTLSPREAALHGLQARLHERNGSQTEAATAWQLAVTLDPDDATACVGLAGVRRREGRLREAEALARKALRLQPETPAALLELARVLRDRDGASAEVEGLMRRAAALPHDQPVARSALAGVLMERGCAREAADEYTRVLRLLSARKPPRKGPWNARDEWLAQVLAARFNLARARDAAGQSEVASVHRRRFRALSAARNRIQGLRVRLASRPGDRALAAQLARAEADLAKH